MNFFNFETINRDIYFRDITDDWKTLYKWIITNVIDVILYKTIIETKIL